MAANAEQRKHSKYSHLDATHHFVPIATETLGAIGDEGRAFFSKELGRRIKATTQEPQSHQYVLQSVTGNSEAMLSPYWVRWGEVRVGSCQWTIKTNVV